jgi:hypothetical protein
MSGRTRNTTKQNRSKSDDESQTTTQNDLTVDIELRDQIVEAVEPLISDINEQIVETVRASLSLNGEISDDDDASGQEDDTAEQADDTNAERSSESNENQGAQSMANQTRGDSRETEQTSEQDQGRERRGRKRDQDRSRNGRDKQERAVARRQVQRQRPPARRLVPDEIFDPRGAVPVALLRLGNVSLVNGSIYTAIYAYTQVLERYPDTGAANAAVENLLQLAERLQDQGRFYTALNILNQIEELTY